MRRLPIAVITMVASFALMMPSGAAQAAVQANSQSGPFVTAFFSSAPSSPAPGDQYQDVTIYADGFTGTGPSMSVDITDYVVNSEGFPDLVSDTISGAQGSGISLIVDKHLATASLEVTLEGSKTCYPDGTCNPGPGGTVEMVWSANASPVRLLDNTRVVGPGQFVYTAHSREVTRNATASGSALGLTLDGSLQAMIGMQTLNERLVTH